MLAGCSHFDSLAGEVARNQKAGGEILRRDGVLALRLCRYEAAYNYLRTTLGIGATGPVERPFLFADWYATENATKDPQPKQSWSSYCIDLDKTGEVYHAGVLALSAYAAAVLSITEAKDFDGSSLGKIGDSVGAAADSLRAPSALSSTAKSIGSAASSFSGTVVSLIRTHELKSLLRDSKTAASNLIGSLGDYLDALQDERKAVVHYRSDVLKLIEDRRESGGMFTAASEGALSFDLVADAETQLNAIDQQLRTDRHIVSLIATALAELARAAGGDPDGPANKAASSLTTLLAELAHQRPGGYATPWP
jgi:hypothetical protein